MTQIAEGLILGCLLSGLGITTVILYNEVSTWKKSLGEAILEGLELYKIQIMILIFTLIIGLGVALFFQKRSYKKEKVSLNCTKKISVEEYEKAKKRQTEEAVQKLVNSEVYKKYVEDKNNNRLREVEMTESDRIILSDDSSADEEENNGRGQ